MRVLALLALGALLAGCASVSREECLAGNWDVIGQRDGARGLVAETVFARHQTACARVDVAPDRALWEQGYAQGLRQYCTPRSGLDEGRAGRAYRGVCPAAQEAGFLRGHDLGRAAHRQEQRLRKIDSEIRRIEARNAALAAVPQDPPDPAAPAELAANRSELAFLRLERLQAQAALARVEREIRAFRAGL